ncbi:MAG: hypothetical protein H7066_18530 [Cytophagaceae bacterium]|nr:hypothetical protein [Gemmatimonadaceae bacterium]
MARRPHDATQNKQLRAARTFVVNEPERFLRDCGGQAVGYGPKLRKGVPTGDLAIRLFVRKGGKGKPEGRLVDDRLRLPDPESGDELEILTDVAESAPCVLHRGFDPFGVHDRVPGGVSIGSSATAGGTLGGWAWDLVNDQVVLLSNAHVLGQVREGETIDIRQPAAQKLGSSAEPRLLGRLLRADGLASELVRNVDCAIASVSDMERAHFSVPDMGAAVMRIGDAQCRERVRKFGVSTRLRTGRVAAAFWSGYIDEGVAPVGASPRKILFRDCIKVESGTGTWARAGDSGALVFASAGASLGAGRAVLGLHFAGELDTDSVGYACRIDHVCATLGITSLPHGAARLTVPAPHRNAASATMMELWRRIMVRGRAEPVRLLLSEHRATIGELVIRDAKVRALASHVLAPFVGLGQGLAEAASALIDANVIEGVAAFCDVLREKTHNAGITASCHAVVAWAKEREGRTLGEVLGLGLVVETLGPPSVQQFRTARAALRAYLEQDDQQILARHGAIGVRMGRGARIVLEFENEAPAVVPPISFAGYTFDVTTEVKRRPVKQR